MATAAVHSESKHMYSWWWNSHASPKNSKWLLENRADVDANVKAMIKLIEEDGDTFAKRAEMYYRKRPELLQLVEGFYRAYCALAERYDHSRIGLRRAYKTIAEAFPDQVPSFGHDSLSDGSSEFEGQAFEKQCRSSFSLEILSKETTSGISWNHEKGLKQLSEMFKSEEALQSLKLVHEQTAEGLGIEDNPNCLNDEKHDSYFGNETGNELEALRLAVAEMLVEKESITFQYHQSLAKLLNLESKLTISEDDVRAFDEQRRKAEFEIRSLKDVLTLSETEKDACLVRCQELLDLKTKLEEEVSKALKDSKELDEQALKAENEVRDLKIEVMRLDAEREAGILLYEECRRRISLLDDNIFSAEENVRILREENEVAEDEVKRLRETVNKLNEEKEAATLQYMQCSTIISMLKSELSGAQKDVERLNSELLQGSSKLKSAEDQCALLDRSYQSLKSEVEDMAKVIDSKDRYIVDKQNELLKLQIHIQEKDVQLLKVEASMSTWQKLYAQSQEDHKILAIELRSGLQMVKDMERNKQNLQEELHRAQEENHNLNDMNVSSALRIHELTDETTSLRGVKAKLEKELVQHVDVGNLLQQEINSLKEEIGNLNRKYQNLLDQIESIGLRPESLESSVKDLLKECSKLQEICEQKQFENADILEKLIQRNAALESSLLNVTGELVESKLKLKALQESSDLYQREKSSFVAENASLISQLELATEKMQKLLQRNGTLEDALAVANFELQSLRDESKRTDEIHQFIKNEMLVLQKENDNLVAQLENVEKKLESSEAKFSEVEEKYTALENDKLSTLRRIDELQVSLGIEKQEHSCFKESSEARMEFLETRIGLLNNEERSRKIEFEKREKIMRAEAEIRMLQKLVKDLEEKNLSVMNECERHSEKSMLTNKLIAKLEKENIAQQAEIDFLINEIGNLRSGIFYVYKTLNNDIYNHLGEEIEEQRLLPIILQRLEMVKEDASMNADETQQLLVQNTVLVTFIEQLKPESAGLQSNRGLDQDLIFQKQSSAQDEKQKPLELNELLRLEASEGIHLEEFLNGERDEMFAELLDLHKKFTLLQKEQSKALEENATLLNECSKLKREKEQLEDENNSVAHESVLFSNLSSIFEGYGNEKDSQVRQLTESLDYFSEVNNDLERELETVVKKLEKKEIENFHLKESIQTVRKELSEVKDLNDQLYIEVLSGRKNLAKKELDLSKAKQKQKVSDDFYIEISATAEAFKMECHNSKLICEDLEKRVLELSSDKIKLEREVKYLLEDRRKIDSEISELREDLKMHRAGEENRSAEMQVRSNRSKLWKADAEKL